MVDMGFRKLVVRNSDVKRTRDGKTVLIVEVDGVQTLEVTSSNPRQYIQVPMTLVEKAMEDLTLADLQAATARRADQNGR